MSLCLFMFISIDNGTEVSAMRLKSKAPRDFYKLLFYRKPDKTSKTAYTFLCIFKYFISVANLLQLRMRPLLIRHYSLRVLEKLQVFLLCKTNFKVRTLASRGHPISYHNCSRQEAWRQGRGRGSELHTFCPS